MDLFVYTNKSETGRDAYNKPDFSAYTQLSSNESLARKGKYKRINPLLILQEIMYDSKKKIIKQKKIKSKQVLEKFKIISLRMVNIFRHLGTHLQSRIRTFANF